MLHYPVFSFQLRSLHVTFEPFHPLHCEGGERERERERERESVCVCVREREREKKRGRERVGGEERNVKHMKTFTNSCISEDEISFRSTKPPVFSLNGSGYTTAGKTHQRLDLLNKISLFVHVPTHCYCFFLSELFAKSQTNSTEVERSTFHYHCRLLEASHPPLT